MRETRSFYHRYVVVNVHARKPVTQKNIRTRSRRKKAICFLQQNQVPEARDLLLEIVQIDPRDTESWERLAQSQIMLGDRQSAVVSLSRCLQLRPGDSRCCYNLGLLYRDLGQLEHAVTMLEKALALKSDNSEVAYALGSLLITLHQLDRAEQVFRQHARIRPTNAEGHANLGAVLQARGNLTGACRSYHKAISLKPDLTNAHQNLGNTLAMIGEYADSIAAYKQALRMEPRNRKAISNYLLTLNYIQDIDSQHILDEHRRYGRLFCGNGTKPHGFYSTEKAGLRIGYVSSDFRMHSVAYFLEPILKNHNRDRFEIFCYSGVPIHDHVTNRFKSYADKWRNIVHWPARAVCDQIRQDKIDILIDLAGHTAGNHLSVFCEKPAPVQITYLGYPNTTGISAIDYRITDRTADPDEMDVYYTERLIRKAGCFLCYQPPQAGPDIVNPPVHDNGFITFGSFNSLAKIGPQVIALWSRLLRQIPRAKLIIKNPSLSDETVKGVVVEKFKACGVNPDKLQLIGLIEDLNTHLECYNLIDIALDTFPYNGTTTTCEALWMGVPVITISGNRHASRVGRSLLGVAGLTSLVAEDEAGLVDIAQHFYNDPMQLSRLRSGMRERMKNSPLLDGVAFAEEMESIYLKVCRT